MVKTNLKLLNNTNFIKSNQTAKDISNAIIKSIKESKEQADIIAPMIKGSTKINSLKNMFTFCKNNIKYKKESKDIQTARTLGRILKMKEGDCKHYTTTIASLCKSLNIPIKLRLISQDLFSNEPTHIYCVSKLNGVDYIIDPVLTEFNKQANYTKKYDLQIN